MSHRQLAIAIAVGLLTVTSVQAGLIGQQVTGSLQFSGGPNYFDPVNGHVPAGYLNTFAGPTVTIGDPAVEFGEAADFNVVHADFTDSQLWVSNSSLAIRTASAWTMTLTSATSGVFESLMLVSDGFSPGLTYGLAGDTITINWAGGPVGKGTSFSAFFDIGVAAVPEPGSSALVGLAFLGLGLARRRKI